MLRERRLLAYEVVIGTIRWRLTGNGWAIARAMRTGTSGFSRSGDERDRSADRFARVRAALGAEAAPHTHEPRKG